MKLETAKGVRDFPPEEKIMRQKIVSRLKEVFERYGYNPLETPILERLSTLTAKFAIGEGTDVSKEVFKLKDQGGRDLGLRYELTLSLARFIGMNPQLKMPFKRYEIGRVYRDGPIKLGRYREFWQCDVDVIGVKDMIADAEIISIAQDVFDKLGLDVVVEINSRNLLNAILEEAGVPQEKRVKCMIIIDKIKKQGRDAVVKELKENNITGIDKIMDLISVEGNNNEKLDLFNKVLKSEKGKRGVEELRELFSYLEEIKIDYEFNPALARGLAYYTGPMFEVFLKDSKITSSVAGGGRWDSMIGNFLGKGEYPATGISFGLEPITEAIKMKGINKKSVVQAYIIPIKTIKKCFRIAYRLRMKGLNIDMDMNNKGISKNLDYANKMNIPFVLIIGKKELEENKVKLKDMKTGEERLVTIDEAAQIVQKDGAPRS